MIYFLWLTLALWGVHETNYKFSPLFITKEWSSHRFIGCKRESECDIEQLIQQGKNVYIRTPHQFSDVGNYEIFHPTKDIELKADELMQDKTNVIGIHIRRTDNVEEKMTLSRHFPGRIITQNDIELSRNSSDGILSACVDLVCLSKCRKILGSY